MEYPPPAYLDTADSQPAVLVPPEHGFSPWREQEQSDDERSFY